MLSSNTSSTCPDNMVNFGRLMAEIGSGVWGTLTNFNGFCVLAALLHGIWRQPNFAVLNRGRHLCSAGRPSGWALAHISFFIILFCSVPCGRLSWLPVSFWAHVNITNRIVSYYIRLTDFFQDNLGNRAPERYTSLDFTGTRDDGVAVASIGPYAKDLHVASDGSISMLVPHHSVFYRPDGLPAAQPTASKH